MAVVTIKISAAIPDADRISAIKAELSALEMVKEWANIWAVSAGVDAEPSAEVYVTVEPKPKAQTTKRGRKPKAQVPVQPLSHAAE